MKTLWILVILSYIAVKFSLAQTVAVKIGYTNMDYILSQLPDYKIIESEITSYQNQLQSQLNSKYQEFQTKLNDYQAKVQSGEMLPEIRKDKEQELTDLRASIEKFQADADTSVQKKSAELLQPAYNKIQNAVNEVAREQGYAFVLSTSVGAVPVLLYQDPAYDVTNDVLRKLGVTPATEFPK
jgi:outer membrane protein